MDLSQSLLNAANCRKRQPNAAAGNGAWNRAERRALQGDAAIVTIDSQAFKLGAGYVFQMRGVLRRKPGETQ